MPRAQEPHPEGGPGSAEGRLLRHAAELKRFSRRNFLVGAGAASLLATDMFFTRHVQAERRTNRILTVGDDFAESYYPHSSWILFPGYKTSWEEAQWILNSLRGTLRQRGQLAAVGYSNEGLDIDQIVIEVIEYVREKQLTSLYFYGHSFGGMVATQVAARLLELHGVEVEFILLDSSPYSKFDVLDQSWFEGVVVLYEGGFRVPTVLRGGYELGERIAHKDERTWRQVVDQSLEQLSPIAPSSVLIQSESAYIYHFDATPVRRQARRDPDGLYRQPARRHGELPDGPRSRGPRRLPRTWYPTTGAPTTRCRPMPARSGTRSSTGPSLKSCRTKSSRCLRAAAR